MLVVVVVAVIRQPLVTAAQVEEEVELLNTIVMAVVAGQQEITEPPGAVTLLGVAVLTLEAVVVAEVTETPMVEMAAQVL